MPSQRPQRIWSMPYSPECVEGVFSEVGLPLYGVLGSWGHEGIKRAGSIRLGSRSGQCVSTAAISVCLYSSLVDPLASPLLWATEEPVPDLVYQPSAFFFCARGGFGGFRALGSSRRP